MKIGAISILAALIALIVGLAVWNRLNLDSQRALSLNTDHAKLAETELTTDESSDVALSNRTEVSIHAVNSTNRVQSRDLSDSPSSNNIDSLGRTIEEKQIAARVLSVVGLDATELPNSTRVRLIQSIQELLEIKSQYEAGLIKSYKFESGTLEIDIPTYPEAGNIREMFERRVADTLAGVASESVVKRIGDASNELFDDFGSYRKSLKITQIEDPEGGSFYKIIKEFYPNNETKFTNNSVTQAPLKYETSIFKIEDMVSGEYAGVVPIIEKVFKLNI